MEDNSNFLLLSCSQRKRPDSGFLPALQRYNGPSFQVVRKALRTQPELSATLDIAILSACYGLVAPTTLVPNYDQRMTTNRAETLRADILIALEQLLQKSYTRICISLGQDYLTAVQGIQALIPVCCQVTWIAGSQGARLAKLQRWLYPPGQGTPVETVQLSQQVSGEIGTKPSRQVQLRGVKIKLTLPQIFELAQQALHNRSGPLSTSWHSWYVEVNGERVSLKWLVAVLTGLPVSTFTTSEARRVLTTLGVEVHNI